MAQGANRRASRSFAETGSEEAGESARKERVKNYEENYGGGSAQRSVEKDGEPTASAQEARQVVELLRGREYPPLPIEGVSNAEYIPSLSNCKKQTLTEAANRLGIGGAAQRARKKQELAGILRSALKSYGYMTKGSQFQDQKAAGEDPHPATEPVEVVSEARKKRRRKWVESFKRTREKAQRWTQDVVHPTAPIEVAREVFDALQNWSYGRRRESMNAEESAFSKNLFQKCTKAQLREAATRLGVDHLAEQAKNKQDMIYIIKSALLNYGYTEKPKYNAGRNPKADTNQDKGKERLTQSEIASATRYNIVTNVEDLADALVDAHATKVTVLDVSSECTWTDHFIIATARSMHHLEMLASAAKERAKRRCPDVSDLFPVSIQKSVTKRGGGPWYSVDAGNIVIHLFDEAEQHINGMDLVDIWSDDAGSNVRHFPTNSPSPRPT